MHATHSPGRAAPTNANDTSDGWPMGGEPQELGAELEEFLRQDASDVVPGAAQQSKDDNDQGANTRVGKKGNPRKLPKALRNRLRNLKKF